MNARRPVAALLGVMLAAPTVAAPTAAGSNAAGPPAAEPTRTQPPAELRDPMRPLVIPRGPAPADVERTEPSYVLSAIKSAGPHSHAIVNGVLVHVGETVEGARVRRIESRSVELDTGHGIINLRLNATEIKRHEEPHPVPR